MTDLTFEGDDLAGLGLIRRIAEKDPTTRIVVFSMHDDPAIVSRALSSGAQGYVLKDGPSSELTTAFMRMLAGEPHLSHELALKVAMLRAKGDHSGVQGLTDREHEILSLLGLGNSYDKIAARLGISYKTVTNAMSVMRAKLKLTSLAELIRFAMNNTMDRSP